MNRRRALGCLALMVAIGLASACQGCGDKSGTADALSPEGATSAPEPGTPVGPEAPPPS